MIDNNQNQEMYNQGADIETNYSHMGYQQPVVMYEEDSNGNKKKMIIVLLLLLVAVIGAGLFLWMNNTTTVTESDANTLERELSAEYGFLPGMSDDDIQAKLNEIIDESMLNISINPTPVYEDGKAAGNIRIENSPNNHYGFVVALVRVDTGETIMQTGIIEPGQYVANRALDVVLTAGQYECVAHFVAFDLGNNIEIGQTSTSVLLTVEK